MKLFSLGLCLDSEISHNEMKIFTLGVLKQTKNKDTQTRD